MWFLNWDVYTKNSYYHLRTNWFHFIVKIIYPFFQKFNFQMKYCRHWFNQIKLQFAIHHFFVENTNFPSKQTNIITIYCINVIKSFKKKTLMVRMIEFRWNRHNVDCRKTDSMGRRWLPLWTWQLSPCGGRPWVVIPQSHTLNINARRPLRCHL